MKRLIPLMHTLGCSVLFVGLLELGLAVSVLAEPFAYITNLGSGTVSVIDPVTRKIVEKIGFEIPGVRPEAIQPVGVKITKDGSRAFVALGPANRIAVIDNRVHCRQRRTTIQYIKREGRAFFGIVSGKEVTLSLT